MGSGMSSELLSLHKLERAAYLDFDCRVWLRQVNTHA